MTTLGRYELARPLGEGGRTWEAELIGPAGFRKRVAIRLLDGDDEAQLTRARDQGLLHHPNLVEIYEVDEAEGRWYCAMELVRGGALQALAPLPPRALVDVGLQLCAAVGARRAGGMATGAIDLADVLVEDGVVKLAVAFGDPTDHAPGADVLAVVEVLTSLGGDAGERSGPVVALLAAVSRGELGTIEQLAGSLDGLDVSGPGLSELTPGGVGAPLEGWQLTTRTNLEEAPPCVGRGGLLREVVARLGIARLVTVKGPPGVGKSHLLRVAARARLDAGASEAWWVAPGDRSLAQAVVDVLALPSADDLSGALAERGDVLLVIDPMDGHLWEAHEIVSWLGAAPALRIAVAAREPLRLPGEQLVEVAPLDPGEASELLVQSAGTSPPDLERRVAASGGLPAAVVALGEAARHRDPSDPGVVARRALEAELSTLGRTMAPWEREALAQLALLDGEFSLEQAEGRIDLGGFPDAPWALDVVAALVDRSLLCSQVGVDPPTFHIPAPIRTWARAGASA